MRALQAGCGCGSEPSPLPPSLALPPSPWDPGAGLHLLGGQRVAGAASGGRLPGAREWAQRPPTASGHAGGPGGAVPAGRPAGPAGASGCSTLTMALKRLGNRRKKNLTNKDV